MKKANKIKKIIVEVSCWLAIFLLFIANLVPALTVKEGKDVEKIYLVNLLSGRELSVGSSLEITEIPFYGVLLIALLIVCPILLMIQKKWTKKIGFALSLPLFATVIYYLKTINNTIDLIDKNSYYDFTFTKPGIILLLIAYIIVLACSIFVIVDVMYGKNIDDLLIKTYGNDLETLLEENEKLFIRHLITEEEYNTRRNNLINRG